VSERALEDMLELALALLQSAAEEARARQPAAV
jgi:hypothetical protein